MPSARTTRARSTRLGHLTSVTADADNHAAFWPLVFVMLVIWVAYRLIFRGVEVWFDEIISKAIFFGLPVWLYISIGNGKKLLAPLDTKRIISGLFLGVALGGLYGFVVMIMKAVQPGAVIFPVPFFAQPLFWGHFWLAMVTGFWETLFFYVWIMGVIQDKHRDWPVWQQLAATVLVFSLFHIPNAFLQLPPLGAVRLILLLAIFAGGQALLFYQRRNAYALVLSQAMWGMVLLVHLSSP